MKNEKMMSKDPDIRNSYKALKRAAKRALAFGKMTNTPVYVMEDGKIKDIAKRKNIRSSLSK